MGWIAIINPPEGGWYQQTMMVGSCEVERLFGLLFRPLARIAGGLNELVSVFYERIEFDPFQDGCLGFGDSYGPGIGPPEF
jgi:hypothetical protein